MENASSRDSEYEAIYQCALPLLDKITELEQVIMYSAGDTKSEQDSLSACAVEIRNMFLGRSIEFQIAFAKYVKDTYEIVEAFVLAEYLVGDVERYLETQNPEGQFYSAQEVQ